MITHEDVMKIVRNDLKAASQEVPDQHQNDMKRKVEETSSQQMSNILNRLDLETRRQGGLYS